MDPEVKDWGIRGCKRDKREDRCEDNVDDRDVDAVAVAAWLDAALSTGESIGIGSEGDELCSLDGAGVETAEFSGTANTGDDRSESRSACTPAGSWSRRRYRLVQDNCNKVKCHPSYLDISEVHQRTAVGNGQYLANTSLWALGSSCNVPCRVEDGLTRFGSVDSWRVMSQRLISTPKVEILCTRFANT